MFKKSTLKTVIIACGLLALSTTFVEQAAPIERAYATTSGGGPMVLDGMDPACHAVYGEGTGNYIAKVLKSVHDQSSIPNNSGSIAILGVGSSVGGCGSTWSAQMPTFLGQFTTAPTVQYFNTAAELDTFFATTITSTPPRVIWIPDDWGRSATISNKFTANAEKIADFVNSGGGLFANYNTYGWLTALLPGATFNNGGCNGGPDATSDGTADFGLTNTDVAACWHGYFTGSLGTLKTLAQWRYPDASASPLVAVSIGGGEVSLPSSFTLSISPTTPNAGDDLTITATAQTLAGVPQAGVVVTITVSSGPDAGQTFTATTDASGVATLTVRTSSEGTAVYTATATVNGVAKTVSATVTWNPAPTTTAAPTTTTEPAPTTTEPATTTTEPAPTTTQQPATTVVDTTVAPLLIPVAPVEQTTTTVHDHSSHSHGPLPETGSNSSGWFSWAILLIGGGYCVMLLGRLVRITVKRD